MLTYLTSIPHITGGLIPATCVEVRFEGASFVASDGSRLVHGVPAVSLRGKRTITQDPPRLDVQLQRVTAAASGFVFNTANPFSTPKMDISHRIIYLVNRPGKPMQNTGPIGRSLL
eukprot:4960210-Pyramimonas_sp.AAC.2